LQQGPFGYILYLRIAKNANKCWCSTISKKKEKLTRPNVPERARIVGTDVPCVEKRELLVLLHEPFEMRY